MNELKVTTHISYTYETSDGREFDDETEAKEWQDVLSQFKNVCMLTDKFKPTENIDTAYYVCCKTSEEAHAFNEVNNYDGMAATIAV